MNKFKTSVSASFLFVSLAFPAHAQPSADVQMNIEQVRKLDVKAAASDAKAALARGDKRLLAVRGITLLVPNGPSGGDQNVARNTNGLRISDGTADYIRNAEEKRLNDNAWAYAKIYNRIVLSAH